MQNPVDFFKIWKPALYKRFCDIAAARQSHMQLIMDGVRNPGNLGAILRSCDALGIQHICYLPGAPYKGHKARIETSAMSSEQWLDYTALNDMGHHLDKLHAMGWYVFATSSVEEGKSLYEVDFSTYPKVAILVGSEVDGLSTTAWKKADSRITIPMTGFVESFNVSVAAALVLSEAVRQRQAPAFLLNEEGQKALVKRFIHAYFKKHNVQYAQS